MNKGKKKQVIIDLDEINFFDENIHPNLVRKIRIVDRNSTQTRITSETMTLLEFARIVGARAAQLDGLAKPFVSAEDVTDSIQLALKELKEGKIPLKIQREIREGLIEEWSIGEMVLPFQESLSKK
jgi:DNA-directed RNA polymerase I, II, and III subunit RPABC2